MRVVACLLAIVCGLMVSSASADDTSLDKKIWHLDLQKAHLVAKQENKPMLVVFGATWCKYCKKLEQETLSDPRMQQYIQQHFVPVHLDLDEQAKIGKILEVKSLPCTVVLSPNADLLGKIVGYKDVAGMQEQLDKALQTGAVLQQASGSRVIK